MKRVSTPLWIAGILMLALIISDSIAVSILTKIDWINGVYSLFIKISVFLLVLIGFHGCGRDAGYDQAKKEKETINSIGENQ